jgi:hypothetical protein
MIGTVLSGCCCGGDVPTCQCASVLFEDLFANEIADPANAGVYGSGIVNYGTRFRITVKNESTFTRSATWSALTGTGRCEFKQGCDYLADGGDIPCAQGDIVGANTLVFRSVGTGSFVLTRDANGTLQLETDEGGTVVATTTETARYKGEYADGSCCNDDVDCDDAVSGVNTLEEAISGGTYGVRAIETDVPGCTADYVVGAGGYGALSSLPSGMPSLTCDGVRDDIGTSYVYSPAPFPGFPGGQGTTNYSLTGVTSSPIDSSCLQGSRNSRRGTS